MSGASIPGGWGGRVQFIGSSGALAKTGVCSGTGIPRARFG
jgi:hypothetical protein